MPIAGPLSNTPSNNSSGKLKPQSQGNISGADENVAPSNVKQNSMDVKSLMDKMKSKAGIKPFNDQYTPSKNVITGPGWVKMPAFPSPNGVSEVERVVNVSSFVVKKPVEKQLKLEDIINDALFTPNNINNTSYDHDTDMINLSESLTEDEAHDILTSIEFPTRKKKKQYISESLFKIVCSGNLNGLQTNIKPADVHLTDKNGLTLLHLSCMLGHIYITQYLVQVLEADVNIQDKIGLTPLHYACKGLHLITVRYLVMFCGCNLTLADSFDRLPTTLCGLDLNEKNAQYILEILLVVQAGLEVTASDRSKVLRL